MHTLNGSALAVGRCMIALLENGSVKTGLLCRHFCTAIWNRCSGPQRAEQLCGFSTNDDGLDAEGLHLLEELVLQVTDDVCVCAAGQPVRGRPGHQSA